VMASSNMTNPITIRSATEHEAGEISELAMRSKAHWGYSQEFLEACREELTVTPESINSADLHYVVAESASKLLGYYAIEKCAEFEYELDAIFVEPKHIGERESVSISGRSLPLFVIELASEE
jgi:hypothetical protein